MKTFRICSLIVKIFWLVAVGGRVSAQTTMFTYQGSLVDGGSPANGVYNLKFTLFNSSLNGVGIAGPVTNNAVSVSNGLFSATIDFGAAPFNGSDCWLEIGVQTNGANGYTVIMPRQQITPTPYAIYSATAGSATSFSGDGSAVTNLDASQIVTGTIDDGLLSSNVALLDAANNFTGANSFNGLSQFGSGSDTQTNLVVNGQYNYMIGNGSWFTTPVPFLRPTMLNRAIAFDIMPNGAAANTWIDICSTDYYTNHTAQLANGEHLHLAKDANGDGHISLLALGTGAYRNLHLQDAVNYQNMFFGQNNDISFYQNLNPLGELPGGAAIETSGNNLAVIPNGDGNKIVLGYRDFTGNRSALDYANNLGGFFSTLNLMKSGGHVAVGGDLSVQNGISSLATNVVGAVLNFIGTTNTSGYAQIWNVSGAGGSVIFYNRSDIGGATICGTALWTNTISSSGSDILVGQNCGIAIKSGNGVSGSGRAF